MAKKQVGKKSAKIGFGTEVGCLIPGRWNVGCVLNGGICPTAKVTVTLPSATDLSPKTLGDEVERDVMNSG